MFEKEINLWAYPVESVFAEKLETSVARADQNSRMKDYHDLALLIRNDVADIKKLKVSIKDTFSNRETKPSLLSIPKDQQDNIQKYWAAYRKSLSSEALADLPEDLKSLVEEINGFITSKKLLGF